MKRGMAVILIVLMVTAAAVASGGNGQAGPNPENNTYRSQHCVNRENGEYGYEMHRYRSTGRQHCFQDRADPNNNNDRTCYQNEECPYNEECEEQGRHENCIRENNEENATWERPVYDNTGRNHRRGGCRNR